MKKLLFIHLVIYGFTLAQDVLIDKDGNIYKGTLIVYNNSSVEFLISNQGEEELLIFQWDDVNRIELSNGKILTDYKPFSKNLYNFGGAFIIIGGLSGIFNFKRDELICNPLYEDCVYKAKERAQSIEDVQIFSYTMITLGGFLIWLDNSITKSQQPPN